VPGVAGAPNVSIAKEQEFFAIFGGLHRGGGSGHIPMVSEAAEER